MSDRLLTPIRSRSRPLRVIVGLLVLTLGLTVVLTVRAQRVEAARQAQARAVLQDMVERAAAEWSRMLRATVATGVKQTHLRAWRLLLATPDAALAAFAAEAEPALLCVACELQSDATGFFLHDLTSGQTEALGGEAPSAELLSAIAAHAARREFAVFHELFGLGMYAVESGGVLQAAAVTVISDARGEPVRAVGHLLPPAQLAQLVHLGFNELALLPSSLARGQKNDAIFTARARVGSIAFAPDRRGTDIVAAVSTDTDPLFGVAVEVGLSERAAHDLLATGGLASGVPVLVALLLAITVLIGLALLLVRREAELARLRADFISGVTHELRTPLAQIRMFTETLLLGRIRSDLERRRSIEVIEQEANRLALLVENVLLFSRTEGGRRPHLTPVPSSFAAEIRRAAESFAPLCATTGTELRTELQEDIVVPVDRGALRQIMLNLIDNALKYGPEGQRVTIGAALFDDTARVWVDDEGRGIPADQRERVFESFYRMPRDVDSATTGSGIGLAVVRELALLHGGTARAEAAPGGGARLVVDFPDAYLRAQSTADLAAAS